MIHTFFEFCWLAVRWVRKILLGKSVRRRSRNERLWNFVRDIKWRLVKYEGLVAATEAKMALYIEAKGGRRG